ncbi:MAG: dephospho-CoA kinase [Bacteroidales bacterium]|nr:dephospho-CoA kinase [Bacteroidales bacterium]
MLKVALTGNMGSGKTVICRFFEMLNVPVFYADIEAKKLYTNPSIIQKVKALFGKGVITSEGSVDKKALAGKVFSNKEKLKELNKIIHPEVHKMFDQWAKQQESKPYCMQEAAIIFETGGYKRFDKTILVHAPEEILIERVMKRDTISRTEVLDRLQNQMSQERKKELADYLLPNDNSMLLIPRILEIHSELMHLSVEGH